MVSITPEKLVDLVVAISTNLHRRHLTESQRASIAARLANLRDGQRADHSAARSANLRSFAIDTVLAPVSSADAAKLLNVSTRSVETARKVQAEAPAEIVRAVDDGRISVSLAAQVRQKGDGRKLVTEEELPTPARRT
jgi:hypothetical protein